MTLKSAILLIAPALVVVLLLLTNADAGDMERKLGQRHWSMDRGSQVQVRRLRQGLDRCREKGVLKALKDWSKESGKITFEEASSNADMNLKWADPADGDDDTVGEMIGGDGTDPPTGVNFNPSPTANGM